jgi:hypothetical protein
MDDREDVAGSAVPGRVFRDVCVLRVYFGDPPEKIEGIEIDFVMESLERADDFLVQSDPIIGFA